MKKLGIRLGAVALCLFASLTAADDARACGGCFHPETQPNQPAEMSSVVLAHRMALSVSPDASVLWDQVQYAGSPTEFAWVLPVKPGARIEVASDAWFEALDAATNVRVAAPTIQCVTQVQQQVPDYNYRYGACAASNMAAGCGASGEAIGAMTETTEVTEVSTLAPPPDPVTIVHQGSAGPYETVTLHSDVPGALPDWLTMHGYAIDADIQPIIDAYSQEGFDFIALRLLPDKGVQQMKPVRVIQPGAVTALPLRMVAAGTGPQVALTLFVIGEGRYLPTNFPVGDRPGSVNWDFLYQQSDYATQRANALSYNANWITASAAPGALFGPLLDPSTGGYVQYQTGLGASTTIADAFMQQALSNGEAAISCAGTFDLLVSNNNKVVDLCPADGSECADPAPGELDMRYLECGPVKDLAVAMVGLHPADIWVTRLEANLPRAALNVDLQLGAATTQSQVSTVIVADSYTNPPCQVASGAALTGHGGRPSRRPPLVAAAMVVALGALLRRLRRRKMEPSRATA